MFGVANFSLVETTARDIEALRARILEALNGTRFESFRIETQRGDKTFPLNSPEINRRLGAAVKEKSAARVDLTHPELTVFVEILPRDAFFGFNKIPGAGGLPRYRRATARRGALHRHDLPSPPIECRVAG